MLLTLPSFQRCSAVRLSPRHPQCRGLSLLPIMLAEARELLKCSCCVNYCPIAALFTSDCILRGVGRHDSDPTNPSLP